MREQRLPSLDGVIVRGARFTEPRDLMRAAELCKTATKAAREIRAAGVPGRIETDENGVLTMHGSDWDRVEWRDARAVGGYLEAEHWSEIPKGRDGAGDHQRMIQLRWPVLSRPGTFMPTDLFDLSNVFMAGWRVCSLAATERTPDVALAACETVLRCALTEDQEFEFATPWTHALFGTRFEPDDEPTGHDAALVALVASRAPPCVEVRVLGGDDDKAIVTPSHAQAGSHFPDRPGTVDVMRALSIVEALPVLRDPVTSRRRRKAEPKA